MEWNIQNIATDLKNKVIFYSILFEPTLFEIFLALSAYTRVFLLSSLCLSAGLMCAIITVWQFPFRVSFNSLKHSGFIQVVLPLVSTSLACYLGSLHISSFSQPVHLYSCQGLEESGWYELLPSAASLCSKYIFVLVFYRKLEINSRGREWEELYCFKTLIINHPVFPILVVIKGVNKGIPGVVQKYHSNHSINKHIL